MNGLVQSGVVAVGPGVDGLKGRPAHLAEERVGSRGNYICLPCGGLALATAGRVVGNVGSLPACVSLVVGKG